MSNMSYCRFQNTLGDLRDCYEALPYPDDLSEDEKYAMKQLIKLCATITEEYGEE